MDFWEKSFVNRIFDPDYEAFVEGQKSKTRQLFDYPGLDWETNCLHPEKMMDEYRLPPLCRLGKNSIREAHRIGENTSRFFVTGLKNCLNNKSILSVDASLVCRINDGFNSAEYSFDY